MFIQSQLLQNGRNSAPRAEYSAALKQWAQRLPGAATPGSRGFCASGFLPQVQHWVRHRPHAHHTGYNRHNSLTNRCGSHLTEDALKHPETNLVTLSAGLPHQECVHWVSLFWQLWEQRTKQRSVKFWPNQWARDLCCLFQWKAYDGAHGSIWALTVFSSRERESIHD